MSSIVFLDNVLPGIPVEIDVRPRVRAREITFPKSTKNFENVTYEPQSKFDFLIEDLGEGVTKGGINQVREYYNRSEFDHAIALAAEIVKSDPANYDATRLLARTLDRVGDNENALIIWDEMKTRFTLDEEIATRRIRITYANNELQRCADACNDLLESKFNDEFGYRMLAKTLTKLGREEEALVTWKEVESIKEDVEVTSTIDRQMYKLGEFEELRERLLGRLDKDQLHLGDLRLLAKVEVKSGNKNQIATHQKIANTTNEPEDWYHLARICFNNNEYQQSLNTLEKLLNISAEHVAGLELKVRVLLLLGDQKLALQQMDEMNSKGFLNQKLAIRRADILYNLGEWQNALISYQELSKKFEDRAVFRGIIRCYIAEERFEQALEELDTLEELSDFEFVKLKLVCFDKLSLFDELIEYLQNKPLLVEEYPALLDFAAIAEKKAGRPRRAIELWKKIQSLRPGDVTIILSMASSFYDLYEHEDSMHWISKVLNSEPENVRALWLKSQIHIRKLEWEPAFETLEILCDLYPNEIKFSRSYIEILYRLNRRSEVAKFFDHVVENVNSIQSKIDLIFLAEEFLLSEKARKLCDSVLRNPETLPENLLKLSYGYYSIGRAGSASRFASRLQQRDKNLFDSSKQISKLLNLLEISNTSLHECGGDPFWGQWKDEVYNLELIAKAIVHRTKQSVNHYSSIQNVGFVSSTIGRGGAERQMMFCLNSLQADLTSNYNLDLFLYKNSSRDPDETYLGQLNQHSLTIKDFGLISGINPLDHPLSHQLEPWMEIISHIPNISANQSNLISLFYQFVEGDYHLIHAWQDVTNVITTMAALMAGVPRILMSARSLSPNTKTMLHMRKAVFLRGAYLQLLKSQRVILCHNSEAGAQSYRNWLGTDQFNFPIIHNGTKFDELIGNFDNNDALTINQFLKWKKGRIVVGSVFRFVPEKRPLLWVDVASNALRTRRDICFLMVGDGPLYEQAKEKVEKSGFSDYFYFPGMSNCVGSWLEQMDLFLLTSKIEGLPNVIIEAQGFGVPVISTDAGGAEEVIIPDITGKICTKDHDLDITESLLEAIEAEDWRSNAKQISRGHAREKFSIQGMYCRLLELYQMFD